MYPPTSGGTIRTSGIAEGLAQQGFQVRIFSLIGRKGNLFQPSSLSKPAGPLDVEEYVLRPSWLTLVGILSFKLGIFPLWAWAWLKIWGRHSKPLRDLTQDSEVVIADFPFVYPIFEQANHARKVLNTHNIETNLATGRFSKKAVRYLENQACKGADVITVCSPSDASYFSAQHLCEALVVPNCISPQAFLKNPSLRDDFRKKLNLGERKVCLFSASAYGPNREGYEFLKTFSEENTSFMVENRILFLIIGSVAQKTEASEVLMVTGRVETVAPYFQAADIALNPIFRGEGTSIKVAEYIAAGLPLLTTEVGKRGYQLQDSESAFVFSKDNFKEQLDKLLGISDTSRFTVRARDANLAALQVKEALKPLAHWIHDHV